MRTKRGGGGAIVLALLATFFIPGPARGIQGDIKIAVAPLEVHGSLPTLQSAAKEVRAKLADALDDLQGFVAVTAPEGAEDAASSPLTNEALGKTAAGAGATYVLYGSLTQLGGTYSFDARLYDPDDGKSKAAFFREGAGREDLIGKLPNLAAEVGRSLEPAAPEAISGGDTGEGQVSGGAADSSNSRARAGATGDSGVKDPLGLRVRDNRTPIAITSDTLEAINKRNTVVFRGNVEAKQGRLRIYCDVMTVLYSSDGKGINKIIADRNVRIIHEGDGKGGNASEKITATCDQGIYYSAEGRIDLTGDPVVKRGSDTVLGDKISVYLEDNRFTVRQATVTISPQGMQTLDQGGGAAAARSGTGVTSP
ncbi:MAG: LptA/OstA family protein [Deltaproteobacteria bacterium]|nr:LptA/OstA family protein [Deltaproteobacteria bacterium]